MKIVTGMHRSGTSFLAQALHHLGADFGPLDLLFPADRWNQNGYFENIEIVDLNNRMILGPKARIDLWLNAPEGGIERALNSLRSRKWKYFLFPSRKSIVKQGFAFEDHILGLMRTYDNQFVKDPRFCLTLETWATLGRIDEIVFSFRNPTAVADSVWRRERLPRAFGYRYWSYHVENFFRSLDAETPVFLVDFDAFFESRRQEEAFGRLGTFLKLEADDPRLLSLPATLDIKLRTATPLSPTAPKQVRRVYGALLRLMAEKKDQPIYRADYENILQEIGSTPKEPETT
ncbi:MAG: hypothetical protein V2I43_11275 [Parvularcula sp.]|jgi:hypothetical protein|nr:hypothetical protein [Parvularcula sp.]